MAARTRRAIVCYLVLTFALSAVFYAWSFAGAPLDRVTPLLMWMPAVAAIVTQLAFFRSLAGLGWRPGPVRYLGLAAVIPLGYCTLIYLPVWLTGLGGFNAAYLQRVLPLLPLALAFGLAVALGEEIGWRGFLVPAFYDTGGFGWAGLGTGLIWAAWHVPLIVGGGYDAGTPAWFAIPCFVIFTAGLSVMMAWLRLRAGSVWPPTICHAIHNLAIQGLFDGSTVDTGLTRWITTEFGLGMVLVSIVLGAYFWRRRGELPAANRDQRPPAAATA